MAGKRLKVDEHKSKKKIVGAFFLILIILLAIAGTYYYFEIYNKTEVSSETNTILPEVVEEPEPE